MLMTDIIANMIEEMLRESNGALELRRNDLAGRIGCVPSQINYVITSRFTPERGYIIESRRGGGGYVRITKVSMTRDEYLKRIFHSIGNSLDMPSCSALIGAMYDNELITKRENNIIRSVFSIDMDGEVRADMMRQIILALMR